MKHLHAYIFSIIFIFITLTSTFQPAYGSEKDYYSEGLALLKTGDWEGALKIWWTGRYELERQGTTDPRIGIAFIELVAEKKIEKYYETASEIYLWAFSQEPLPEFRQSMIEEADRIILLLDEDEQHSWKKMVKRRNPALWSNIRRFWIERDPRPATEVNERLIKHWERIAHARKHFRRNKNSPYLIDDRGTIYVKYGKPGREKSGHFGSSAASELELMRWCPNMADKNGRMRWDTNAWSIRLSNPSPEYEV